MMQVKRFVAATFAEALIQAKNELGTDAMIVESKKLKVGGFLGFFRRELTELTVAVDKPSDSPSPSGVKPSGASGRPHSAARAAYAAVAGTDTVSAPEAPAAPAPASGRAAGNAPALATLEREVAGLRSAIGRLLDRPAEMPGSSASQSPLAGFGRQVFEDLVARGVEESLALEIGLRTGEDPEVGRTLLEQELSRCVGRTFPIEACAGRRRIIALVGPTGVGKTTTLAKLAAHFTLEQELEVALVTADTFRIAAIEQLRTYADILGVPLYTVETPDEAARALRETMRCDLVLVDTAGRNHKDADRMEELQELLDLVRPDETHLVVSLTSHPKDAESAVEAYLPLGVNRLIFTKLDEASAPGQLINICRRWQHPLSYVTNGQSVPEDIVPAHKVDLTKVLAGV